MAVSRNRNLKIKSKNDSKKVTGKTYHHPELRSQLIKGALTFLKNHRADELSLRELARQVGVSHMAPYRHFQSKEDLLVAVIEDGFNRLTELFNEDFKKYDDFAKLFHEMGKTYLRFVMENTDQARVMFSGLLCDPEKHPKAHAAGQATFMKLIEMILMGQEKGFLKKEDPNQMGLFIWSTVHGVSMLTIESQFDHLAKAIGKSFDSENFMNFVALTIMKGLNT